MGILDTFDPARQALIDPSHHIKPVPGFPEVVILTYSNRIILNLLKIDGIRKISETYSPNGTYPIYCLSDNGKAIAFMMIPIGAGAASAVLEEVIAMGVKTVVSFGSCFVLDKTIMSGQVIVPTEAYRDEGASYHYLAAKDFITLKNADRLTGIFYEMRVRCVKGKTWTTDSIYRETAYNTEKMRKLGCICTERECSALAAVCEFRNVKFYQFFYASDHLDSVNRDEGLVGQLNETRRIRYMKMAIAIAEKVCEQSK